MAGGTTTDTTQAVFSCPWQSSFADIRVPRGVESTEALYSSNLRRLMALNQISLMSFWKLNPGRDYTMHVPRFQRIPLPIYTCWIRGKAATCEECELLTKLPPRYKGISGTCWKGLWQHQPMPRSRLHCTARVLQQLCPSSSHTMPPTTGETWITTCLLLLYQLTCLRTQSEVQEINMHIYKTQQDLGVALGDRRGALLLLHRWAGLTAKPVTSPVSLLWAHLCWEVNRVPYRLRDRWFHLSFIT